MEFKDAEKLKYDFYKIQNVSQLAVLLTRIRNLRADNKINITARDLFFLARTKEDRYKTKLIPKKNGTERIIDAPDDFLKEIQKTLNILLQIVFFNYHPTSSNGFLKGRSVIRNARAHINKSIILNIDIKDFFHSINFRRVKTVLELEPFNLVEEREFIGFIIANLITYNNHLPQGAPTSPIASNIVTQKLDKRLNRFSKKRGIKYTRYADDLSFSSNKTTINDNTLNQITKIISKENFVINHKKTRFSKPWFRQEVTGIIVNQKVNIKREYINSTRAILNNWEKKGKIYAQSRFETFKKSERRIDFIQSLKGRIEYIGLVKGRDSKIYQKLKVKFYHLFLRESLNKIPHKELKQTLIRDNITMELNLILDGYNQQERFIMFCTSAFHQIENILNFYYTQRFPNISDLIEYLHEKNSEFHSKFKKSNRKFRTVKNLNISYLVYIFEKEFFFEKKKYDKTITLLREVRNEQSHRCTIVQRNKEEILNEYAQVKAKWTNYKKKNNGRNPEKQPDEINIEKNVKLIEFMDQMDVNKVRRTLQYVVDILIKEIS